MPDRRSANIRISLDNAQVRAILSELRDMPKNMDKAEVAAVRRTMKSAETRIAKGITQVANLKSSDVKDRIIQKRQPSTTLPAGVIQIKGTRIPLWKFSRSMSELGGFVSQKGKRRGGKLSKKKEQGKLDAGAKPGREPAKGASWKIYKSGSKERSKMFFLDKTTKRGQIQIFQRLPFARGGKQAQPGVDYRIKFGLSLVKIIEAKQLKAPAMKDIADILEKNLRSQVDRFLKRKKSAR